MRAFEACRFRTTSRSEDTYICLANLLEWKWNHLASEPVQRRMRLLLEQESTLPQGLLFIPGPRSIKTGWGWSVIDFDHESQNEMLAPIGDTTPAHRDARGITVTYPAICFRAASGSGKNRKIVLSSVSPGSGDQGRCRWRLSLLPSAGPRLLALLNSAQCQAAICVVYYSQLAHEAPSILMAAAVLAVNQDQQSKLRSSDSEVEIFATFIGLAMLEKINAVESLGDGSNKTDLQPRQITEAAQLSRRRWKVR